MEKPNFKDMTDETLVGFVQGMLASGTLTPIMANVLTELLKRFSEDLESEVGADGAPDDEIAREIRSLIRTLTADCVDTIQHDYLCNFYLAVKTTRHILDCPTSKARDVVLSLARDYDWGKTYVPSPVQLCATLYRVDIGIIRYDYEKSGKIYAIKTAREILCCSLKDAKEVVELLASRDGWGLPK